MASSINGIIAEIKADIGRMANRISRGLANVALNDMRIAHEEIMESFYGGYTRVKNYRYHYTRNGRDYIGYAHGYKRTNNLRSNSIIPEGVAGAGKHAFKATVMIGASGMSDYVNNSGHTFPASGVFDLMWNESIRGLPPGYRGHVEFFSINAAPVGIGISGSPDSAMNDFVERWGQERGAKMADSFAGI